MEYEPAILAIMYSLACLCLLPFAFASALNRFRQNRWFKSLSIFRTRFNRYTTLRSFREWFQWLSNNWAGEIKITEGPAKKPVSGPAVSLEVNGYSSLVLANIPSMSSFFSSAPSKPRVTVLVSAWVPGLSNEKDTKVKPKGDGLKARKRLNAEGYQVIISEAGIAAEKHNKQAKRLYSSPSAGIELSQVLNDLTQIALSIGAQPTRPSSGGFQVIQDRHSETTQDQSISVPCHNCGASIPLLSQDNNDCVYCGNTQPLPADLQEVMAKEAALNKDYEEVLGKIRDTFHSSMKRKLSAEIYAAIFIIGFALLLLPYLSFRLYHAAEGEVTTTHIVLSILGSLAILGYFAAIAIVPVVFTIRSRRKHFAKLPMTVSYVEKSQLVADCAGCGVRLEPGIVSDIAAKCDHCDTESLMPLPLVQPHLKSKHQHIMKQRMNTYGPTSKAIMESTVGRQQVLEVVAFIAILPVIGAIIFYVISEIFGKS